MIERHITFQVPAGKAAAFEAFFAESYRPAMENSPGYIIAALLREIDDPTRFQMTLRFSGPDAAKTWRESDVHQALQPALVALHSGMEIVGYDVLS